MKIISYAKQTPEYGTGYVYLWTNLINGHQYIGSHNGKNPDYITSGIRIRKAMLKYGLENFERTILYTGPRYWEVETEMLISINAAKSSNGWYNDTNNEKFEGQPTFSDETRNKMSIAKSGENHPFWGKFGEAHHNFGRKASEETRAKQSAGGRGKLRSEETKARMSVAQTGHTVSEETRAKISEQKKGVPRPPGAAAKSGLGLKGRIKSAEECARISTAKKGKPHRGTHTRWHISKGIFNPDCTFCTSEAS